MNAMAAKIRMPLSPLKWLRFSKRLQPFCAFIKIPSVDFKFDSICVGSDRDSVGVVLGMKKAAKKKTQQNRRYGRIRCCYCALVLMLILSYYFSLGLSLSFPLNICQTNHERSSFRFLLCCSILVWPNLFLRQWRSRWDVWEFCHWHLFLTSK